MRAPFSLRELVRLTGLTADDVEAYREHGLLDLDGDGIFDDYDLLRAWYLVSRHPEAAPEDVARELEGGHLQNPWTEMLFRGRGTGYTLEETASRIGVEAEELRVTLSALGIWQSTFDDRDVEGLRSMKLIRDAGLPWEASVEGARVMGETLGRLADAEIRLFHFHVHERLRHAGIEGQELISTVQSSGEVMLGLLDKVITYVHEKHLLRANTQDLVLFHLEEKPPAEVPGSMEAAVAFVDLASFTSMAYEAGDVAAAEVLDRLAEVMRTIATEHGGTVVKQLGDGFMLTFPDPADAVRFAARSINRFRSQEEAVSLRIGAHTGPVLYRAGDYVGNTVNVASRVASMAMPNELLMTEQVADAAAEAGLEVESAGVRGASEAMPMFRLARGRDAERDPVCGATLTGEPAARLTSGNRQLAFCSEECLRRFLDAPDRYPVSTT